MTHAAADPAGAMDRVRRHVAEAVDFALGDPLGPVALPTPMEAVAAAVDDGYRAVLLNDHLETVAPVAAFLRDSPVFRPAASVTAGVVLNNSVGGLNVFAAEHCLMLAGRLVAMPTLSSLNYRRKFRRALARGHNAPDAPLAALLSIVDERFRLKPEVHEILDLVAARDAVLDAGYIHLSEVWVLVEEARKHGIGRLLVRDPDRYAGAAPEEIGALAAAGAVIGFTLGDAADEVERFAGYARVPADRLVLHVVPRPHPRHRLEVTAAFVAAISEAGAGADDVAAMLAATGTRLVDG